jgi:hypothetical protein
MNFVIFTWLNPKRRMALIAASIDSVVLMLLGIPISLLLGPLVGCLIPYFIGNLQRTWNL